MLSYTFSDLNVEMIFGLGFFFAVGKRHSCSLMLTDLCFFFFFFPSNDHLRPACWINQIKRTAYKHDITLGNVCLPKLQ